jgi:copper resistance protein B
MSRRRSRAFVVGVALVASTWAAKGESPTGAPEDWPEPMAMHESLGLFVLADQLEFRVHDGDDQARWEIEGWAGGDTHRLWFETEGELHASGDENDEAEMQLLYGLQIAPFWDLRAGIRHDRLVGPGRNHDRSFVVIDVEGLAPYWFELTPALFLSGDGDLSARLTATTDVLLTQRLVAQPRLELNVAAHDVPKFGVARGFNDVELGLRLRYEIRREFAPYVGVNWLRQLGNTDDLAQDDGAGVVGFVAGVRVWF